MESIGLLTALVLVLATFRLTRLVVGDKLLEGMRTRTVGSKLGYLITCPFCMSMWVGAGLATGQGLVGDEWGWQVFIGALALSAVVSVLATLLPNLFD